MKLRLTEELAVEVNLIFMSSRVLAVTRLNVIGENCGVHLLYVVFGWEPCFHDCGYNGYSSFPVPPW